MLFAVALIASGISSSVVGTMAGQIVMRDFVGFRIPVWVRRLATTVPALVITGSVASRHRRWCQIVLSLALPLPVVPLALFTRWQDVMGLLVIKPLGSATAIGAAILVMMLDLTLRLRSALWAEPAQRSTLGAH